MAPGKNSRTVEKETQQQIKRADTGRNRSLISATIRLASKKDINERTVD